MIIETENTKAFYNTEIPIDWKLKNINELFYFKQGVQCAVENQFETSNESRLRFIRIIDLTNQNEPIRYIEDPGQEHHVKFDDLFMIRYGTPGVLGFGYSGVIANNLFRIIPKSETINHFYFYQLTFKEKQIQKLASSSTMPALNFDSLNQLKILVPPLPEQKAIAQVLSTADAAIHTTEKIIAQKELRKKWLMQQLLTGKKRLKGFGGEWKEIHIRDVAKEVSIRNKSDKQLTVLSCTKYDGLVPSLEYFGRKIFADDVSTYKIVPKNHFAYATNHIEEGSIGYQKILDEALISPMYTVFKTDKTVNDDFFYKLLKSHPLVYQYQNRMEGSIDRRGGLRWDGFSIIKIKLPSYEEQTAITLVLQAADKEISLLKAKAEKLKEQKKGLMQVLLTGKVRLKINNT